ncbi:putative LuxR family transcriptional regulator [Gordonia paraffinivorans NBRC 108238]|uniref:LuxR family transcriptional regulator n=1 Tax=Gordonia paraffinivorans NBRC 108238 TaxID=1223543 RepID=A0ABQ0IMA9_9ACTN|nr:LuxR C-terminal-related transcriptional regulator [Gordonia paraffinivorans]GAC84640.1 putative LuxR family transcriptional regulator [Gordonia paraffinivorans NBRC 108238]
MNVEESEPTVEAAVRALSRAAGGLDTSTQSTTRGVVDGQTALEMIAAVQRVLSGLPTDPELEQATLDLRASQAEILAAEVARQRSKLSVLREQLTRLRAARTVDDLADAIPIEAAGLGYERALFSWVRDERWIPRSGHSLGDPHEARAMVAAGGPPYQEIRYLNEVRVVRERKSILVLGVADNPRVHPTILPVTRSVTYTAGPVVARGRVAGMVHVDRNLETGLTDEFDRDLLGLFCESVGVALDRLLTAEEIGQAQTTPSEAEWLGTLTEREREVLRLVAEGLTNAEISARLYVSPETTKSHVKRLMRKMGVRTRSQAGAMFHAAGAA